MYIPRYLNGIAIQPQLRNFKKNRLIHFIYPNFTYVAFVKVNFKARSNFKTPKHRFNSHNASKLRLAKEQSIVSKLQFNMYAITGNFYPSKAPILDASLTNSANPYFCRTTINENRNCS